MVRYTRCEPLGGDEIFLMLVFVSIFTLISIGAKQRTWLAICGSLGGGMYIAEH